MLPNRICFPSICCISTSCKHLNKIQKGSFSFTVDELHNPNSSYSFLESPKQVTDTPTIKKVSPPLENIPERRISESNIQLLSASLYNQLFGNDPGPKYDNNLMKKAKDELIKFGLWKNVENLSDVKLHLPALEGNNIEEHFWNIGTQQSGPYKNLLLLAIKSEIPKPPSNWLLKKGWTRYVDGCEPEAVHFPKEDFLVLDVEVSVRVGAAPTLATAVSPSAWYGWVCDSLPSTIDPVPTQRYSPNLLIPLEGKGCNRSQARVVVGHNVSYDRARIKEQYKLENSALRFFDTMSMHICIGGVTSYQRAMLKTKVSTDDGEWREYSSLNSLKEVYKLYCQEELSKEKRNVFVDGDFSEIRNDFQDLMKYCAGDVIATFKILQKMVPLFFDRFPHPVTLAGMLEMGTAYLPINENWERYIIDSEQTFDDLEKECKFLLTRKGDAACRLLHDNKYKDDLWLWDEDWSTQELSLTKKKVKLEKASQNEEENSEEENLEDRFLHLFNTSSRLPVRKPHLPGYPLWYRKLCQKLGNEDWVPGPQLISTGVKVTPKLLKLTWEGYPLHYTRQHGWGILVADTNAEPGDTNVPFEKLKEITIENNKNKNDYGNIEQNIENLQKKVEENFAKDDYWNNNKAINNYSSLGVWCDYMVEECCHFLKLPHKDGDENNVGNPLAKDFLKTFSKSVLSGSDDAAEKVLSIGRMVSYWRNNCERITNQLAVWNEPGMGVILPQVVVCGTLTRRAMEPTWMTASNAQTERVGSELRAMVQSPPGYHLVGADVDSQELWIASVIGDAAFAKTHGATPFGWMTLSGTKANGTDMHSVTAAAAGISRDHAKVINYARIYGAGVRFAQRLLKQFNPEMSDTEAKNKAKKMFLLTKGQKVYKLKPHFQDQLPEDICDSHTIYSASRIAKMLGKSVGEVFEHPKWEGGTESAMFNRLEEVACSKAPRTPFLSARLSRAVEPRYAEDDSFLTTRINWVVQSGAADFLHLMLVCLRWLSQGKMKFCLSFHDEVRYLVRSDMRYEAALALHITNLLTRAFCARRLGIHDLPQSVAFFSSVEVDKVLRKECRDDCITPSNPHGLLKGYGIPTGESLDIYETIKKCGGKMEKLKPKTRYVESNKKKTRILGTAGVSPTSASTRNSSSVK